MPKKANLNLKEIKKNINTKRLTETINIPKVKVSSPPPEPPKVPKGATKNIQPREKK